jgi:hypothetical protein
MAAIVLEEKVNLLRANYLLDHYQFEDYFRTFNGTIQDAKKEFDKLNKWLSCKACSQNQHVKYNFVKGRTSGRLFGDSGIQTIKSDIRGFLCDGITTDIDMKNAHPCILFKICEKHNILTPCLKLYIDDRTSCLNEIMEKDQICYNQAKKKILISTNSNKHIKSKSDFFKKYDTEMKSIQKKLIEIDDYNEIKEFAKKDLNFEGSFMNHILCINENDILSCMRNYCDINQIKVHSLIFDGMMVYGDINEYTLRLIEEHIKNNTDFDNIQLCIKEHKYEHSMPEDYTPKKKQSYEMVKELFEKNNCKVGCKFVNIIDNIVDIYGVNDFATLHSELKYFGNGKQHRFTTEWFDDENKRKYDRFDCIPKDSLCPKNVFNMWVKFPVQLMPSIENDKCKRALEMFLDHVKVVMCDNNEINYKFICDWISQIFQYPENKSIHLIFIGDEGCGKGVWIKFMQTIMGGSHRCWECTDPQNEIFGSFNDFMKDAFLVILNEADKSGGYNHNNKMKALITDPTINIRPKGKTNFTMKSNHRFISFSNNPDPNVKNKRRDFTQKMSSEKVNDVEYFNELHSYSTDIECCKYIYDYFMKQPVKPTIVAKDIPECEYDEMLKEEQKDSFLEFIEYFTYINRDLKDDKFYPSCLLYSYYCDWCKENYIEYKKTKDRFLMTLGYKIVNVRRDSKWYNNKQQRGWWFDFPELIKELKLVIPDKSEIINDSYDSD